MSGVLKELKATEIAQRISSHFSRIVANGLNENDPYKSGLHLFWPGARASGGRIHVSYVNYQGSSSLTKQEAAHYLKALDDGYIGRHFELFREDPPPQPEAPEIRFTCLVRGSYGFALYGVHKRTKTRVYGEVVAGSAFLPSYVERNHVIRWNATEDDLRAAEAAKKAYEREKGEALDRYRAAIDALRVQADEEAKEDAT